MKNVFQGIAKFQSLITTVKSDATNPHFKSTYTTLESLITEIKPHLVTSGLAFSQVGVVDPAGNQLCQTVLMHVTSGESISSTMICPVTDNNPQKLGSAWSYARRYSLMGILGLSSENEDDDANKAVPTAQSNKVYGSGKADENNLWGASIDFGWVTKSADGKWNYSKEFNSIQNFFGVKKLNEAPQHLKKQIFDTLAKGPHFVDKQATLNNDDLPF
jgi:hypothetical protein